MAWVDLPLRRAMGLTRALRPIIERRSARSTHGDTAPWLQQPVPLFAEDFLYVADFLLNFAGDFLAGTSISQIGIAEGFPGLLFYFAFRFPNAALDFVLCARFHEQESRRPALSGGLFGA
jgi:hypothetical protein